MHLATVLPCVVSVCVCLFVLMPQSSQLLLSDQWHLTKLLKTPLPLLQGQSVLTPACWFFVSPSYVINPGNSFCGFPSILLWTWYANRNVKFWKLWKWFLLGNVLYTCWLLLLILNYNTIDILQTWSWMCFSFLLVCSGGSETATMEMSFFHHRFPL